MDYTTKRQALGELFNKFFTSLGIDPFITGCWILGIYTIYRVIYIIIIYKNEKEYELYDRIYDIILIFTILIYSFGLYARTLR